MRSIVALDCDTPDTALKSASAILNIRADELLCRLRCFNFDSVSEDEKRRHDYETLLILHCLGIGLDDLPTPAMVHWFHATRVPADTTFQDGILPLLMVRERIWTFLGSLASEWVTAADWARFRNNMGGSGASAYQLKTNRMDGPCGFLCRDAILIPENFSVRNYLNIPESIAHICDSFEEMFKHSLRQTFVAATKPCIVKFRSSKPRRAALETALMYIHKHAKNDGERLYLGNTCFDNEGNVIAPNDILRIDWPSPTNA